MAWGEVRDLECREYEWERYRGVCKEENRCVLSARSEVERTRHGSWV